MSELRVYLIYVAALLCLLQQGTQSMCEFPEFVQTNRSSGLSKLSREWRGGIREQFTEYSQKITFHESFMEVVDEKDPRASFSRQCLEALPSHKYIVRHTAAAPDSISIADAHRHDPTVEKYFCVLFILRSISVLQLKYSQASEKVNHGLCNDAGLTIDPWLIVDASHLDTPTGQPQCTLPGGGSSLCPTQHQPCSLAGGFSIRIFERAKRQGVCDSYRGETRIESECVPGEQGLYFYFRHRSCIPSGLYMYATQRTHCVAHWAEDGGESGSFAFSVIKHERLRYMWLIRHALPLLEDSFTAYLFKHLAADTTSHTDVGPDARLRLDTVRDIPRPMTSLCVDEYEACSAWTEPCTSGAQMALSCPRTCKICNASRPRICSFPPDVIGTWLDLTAVTGDVDRLSVTINQTSFSLVVDERTVETFHCITWLQQLPFSSSYNRTTTVTPPRAATIADVMMVTEYTNGCRPRYTCARIQRRSPSLIALQLSQSLTWPLGMTSVTEAIDCRRFNYDHDETTSDGRLRTSRARLFYSRENREPVSCRLPIGRGNYTVTWNQSDNKKRTSASSTCAESIITETDAQTSFTLNLSNCSPPLPIYYQQWPDSVEFSCLRVSRTLPSGDLLIITRRTENHLTLKQTASNLNEVYCWIVYERPLPRTILFLDASRCNVSVTSALRQDASIAPIAVFKSADDVTPLDDVTTVSPRSTVPVPPLMRRWPKTSDQKTGDVYNNHASATGYLDDDASLMNASSEEVVVVQPSSSSSNSSVTPGEPEAVVRNVFVIFAAAVILALLQMPCLCCGYA